MPQRQERTVLDGALTDIDSSAKVPVLTRYRADDGKEYIYLKGIGSTIAGSFVTYDEAGVTTLIAANAVGPVAVAVAATVANKYGWYQVFGVCTTASTDTVAADKALYIDGTSGRADDAVVTGDLIVGAASMTSDTSNIATVFLSYPFVTDALG